MPASATSYARRKIRASASLRASKKMPASATSYARRRHTRVGLLLRAPKMAAPAWTHAKMHVSPLLPAPRRCARLGGYGASTESSLPPFFQPRSPHDQDQREEGVWL